MKFYIDSDFKCHVSNDGTMREVEIDDGAEFCFFRNKCDEFIEAYRYVPAGEEWTRDDGEKFTGAMYSPWILTEEILDAQRAHEMLLITEYSAELQNAVTLAEMDAAYKEGVNAV